MNTSTWQGQGLIKMHTYVKVKDAVVGHVWVLDADAGGLDHYDAS